jgi:glutamate-ammonia-ligase adenylyltransferase
LLRSRSVAGDRAVREAFERERTEVLVVHVDRAKLKEEIRNMRERMRTELSASKTGEFDLKQDPGGLADIEFLVDYRVLSHAAELPELVEFPDNIRQLEALERTGLVPAHDCESLIEIYIRIRERLHELALAGGGRVVDSSEFAQERELVTGLWNAALLD